MLRENTCYPPKIYPSFSILGLLIENPCMDTKVRSSFEHRWGIQPLITHKKDCIKKTYTLLKIKHMYQKSKS